MFSFATNLLKAATAVVLTPVTAVVDIVTLPATASDGEHPFGRTAEMLKKAAAATDEALKPDTE